MAELSIIIVNWNSLDYLRECLPSLAEGSPTIEREVIVVDNASPTGEAEIIEREFPQVSVIKSRENLGFARANNLGFERSTGDFVLFLNPDTRVLGPALETMVRCFRSQPDAGIVGCRLLNTDLSVQTSCIQRYPTILNQMFDFEFLRLRWPNFSLWRIGPLFSDNASPVSVEVISGACLMIRRDLLIQVGGFSREYFMYAEDVYLCYQVAQLGCKSYFVGDASVVHHGGGSSRQHKVNQWAAVMQRKSIEQYCRKTRGAFYAFAYRLAMALTAFFRLLFLFLLFPWKKKTESAGLALQAASRKWSAVLKWAIGMDRQVAPANRNS